MSRSDKIVVITGFEFAAVLLFLLFNVFRIYAFFWKAEDATVIPAKCASKECEIHGTLRIDPWTGDHLVQKKDGKEVRLKASAVREISYPQTGKLTDR